MFEIPVFSEQPLSPRAAQVVRGILDDGYGEDEVRLRRAQFGVDKKVLVFGRAPNVVDTEFVFTYSIAQIMSKANAASVLRAGIRQFIDGADPIPFHAPEGWAGNPNVLMQFDQSKPIAIDIETSGNLGKEHTPEEVGLLSVAFYQPGFPPLVIIAKEPHSDLSAWQVEGLADIMPRFTKGVYHNGKFDIRVLQRVLQQAAGRSVILTNYFDTMLAHHVIHHAAGDHKLKSLARRYCGAPEWEAGLGKYTKAGGHYELIPQDMLVEYNGWDVYWTYKLFEFLEPQIMSDDNNIKAFMLEMAAAEFLLDVEMAGIPWNQAYADKFGEELQFEIEVSLNSLRVVTGSMTFNPASPQQVKRYLESIGHHVEKTDEKTLSGLKDDPFANQETRDFCMLMLTHRKHTKTYNTYVKGWQAHVRHGRVHPTFLIHGTSTGRLSSTSPNAQNVPRDKAVRKLVKAL